MTIRETSSGGSKARRFDAQGHPRRAAFANHMLAMTI
jgi:hypothetical protein